MYRISREGRRSSAHDNHGPDNQPIRYNSKRSLLDNDDKNKNKGFAGGVAGAAGVLPTRNPTAVLCLKVAVGLMVIFFVRGVHRSTCAREQLTVAEAGSTITACEQQLEYEKSARRLAESAVQDMKAKGRGRAGMPGSGPDGQQARAETEANRAGFQGRQRENSRDTGLLADMGGFDGTDAGLLKEDGQTLLAEKREALAEMLQEVDELEAKNKELQAKVVILEEKLDWRRLARGTHEVGADDGKDSSDPDLSNDIKRRRDFSKISDGDPHEDLSSNNTGVPGDPLGDWAVREEFGRRLPPPGDAEDGESDMNRDWGVGGGGGGGSEGGDEGEGGGLPEGVQLDTKNDRDIHDAGGEGRTVVSGGGGGGGDGGGGGGDGGLSVGAWNKEAGFGLSDDVVIEGLQQALGGMDWEVREGVNWDEFSRKYAEENNGELPVASWLNNRNGRPHSRKRRRERGEKRREGEELSSGSPRTIEKRGGAGKKKFLRASHVKEPNEIDTAPVQDPDQLDQGGRGSKDRDDGVAAVPVSRDAGGEAATGSVPDTAEAAPKPRSGHQNPETSSSRENKPSAPGEAVAAQQQRPWRDDGGSQDSEKAEDSPDRDVVDTKGEVAEDRAALLGRFDRLEEKYEDGREGEGQAGPAAVEAAAMGGVGGGVPGAVEQTLGERAERGESLRDVASKNAVEGPLFAPVLEAAQTEAVEVLEALGVAPAVEAAAAGGEGEGQHAGARAGVAPREAPETLEEARKKALDELIANEEEEGEEGHEKEEINMRAGQEEEVEDAGKGEAKQALLSAQGETMKKEGQEEEEEEAVDEDRGSSLKDTAFSSEAMTADETTKEEAAAAAAQQEQQRRVRMEAEEKEDQKGERRQSEELARKHEADFKKMEAEERDEAERAKASEEEGEEEEEEKDEEDETQAHNNKVANKEAEAKRERARQEGAEAREENAEKETVLAQMVMAEVEHDRKMERAAQAKMRVPASSSEKARPEPLPDGSDGAVEQPREQQGFRGEDQDGPEGSFSARQPPVRRGSQNDEEDDEHAEDNLLPSLTSPSSSFPSEEQNKEQEQEQEQEEEEEERLEREEENSQDGDTDDERKKGKVDDDEIARGPSTYRDRDLPPRDAIPAHEAEKRDQEALQFIGQQRQQ